MPSVAEFAALLRDRHLPDRQRGERAVPQRGAKLLQERQHSDVLFDVAAGDRIHAGCPGAPVARDPLPGHQQGGPVADQVEHDQRTGVPVRFLPIGAACADDRVPDAPPSTGPARRRAPLFNGLFATTSLAADHAAALPHVTSFPGLGVLRRLRHDPMPTAGVAPAHRPAGCRSGRAAPGRFPRSLMSVATGSAPSYTPAASPRAAHRSLGPGLPPPKSHRRRERAGQKPRPAQHRKATHPPDSAGR